MSFGTQVRPTKIDLGTTVDLYQKAMSNDDATMTQFLAFGQTEPISSRLGIDQELKNSYQLKIALENPKAYLERRLEIMQAIKVEVNNEYAAVFTKYTTGENKLPLKEAKALAHQASKNYLDRERQSLELTYPEEFGNKAYNAELEKQKANKFNSLHKV